VTSSCFRGITVVSLPSALYFHGSYLEFVFGLDPEIATLVLPKT